MKSIETIYKGYRFRSRLEARWAVFYDCIGIDWRYETEAFDLDGVAYLPDFFLPGVGYVEIKPVEPDEEARNKAQRLAWFTKTMVYIFYGDIPYVEHWDGLSFEGVGSAIACFPDGAEDYSYWWCRCLTCGKFGIEYDGRSDRICRHDDDDRGHNAGDPLLIHAYMMARMIRFDEIGKSH